MTASFPKGGSEYGGYPGLIQPEPHSVSDSAEEQLLSVYRTDPAEATSTPEEEVSKIRRQAKRDLTR